MHRDKEGVDTGTYSNEMGMNHACADYSTCNYTLVYLLFSTTISTFPFKFKQLFVFVNFNTAILLPSSMLPLPFLLQFYSYLYFQFMQVNPNDRFGQVM